MILGAHESIAGGLSRAFERARADGAQCLQIFTKNARGWAAKPLDRKDVEDFRAAARATGLPVIAHCTYLVNLASEDSAMRAKSLAGFTDELSRCQALGIPWLVLHPGAHPDPDTGIDLVARGLDEALDRVGEGSGVLLEITAGQGLSVGHRFEQLAAILAKMRRPGGVGVCLDTCHLYAAGYDIRTPEGFRSTLKQLDRTLGLASVKAVHLNDCKKPLGSRVDRHEEIGAGELGLKSFAPFLKEPALAGAPGILETPDPANYRNNLKKLRSLLSARRPSRGSSG